MMKDAGHPQGLSTGIRSFAVIKERGCAKASLFLVALRKTLYNTEVSDNGKNRGNVMKTLSILSARMLARALSLIKRGGSLPGQIALRIDPDVLSKLKYEGIVILVTGTNGKTSTSNMIADLMMHAGKTVISNRRGDNMRAGVATAILTHCSLSGKVRGNALVLEVDELNVRHLLPQLPVNAMVVTNFFRDQLDRAREMEQLIATIEHALGSFSGTLVLNADDPNVMRLADHAPNASLHTFGVARNAASTEQTGEASEGKFCPRCGSRLIYDYYQYSHVGSFHCSGCAFCSPKPDVLLSDVDLEDHRFSWQQHAFKSPAQGLYTIYNCAAVCAVADLFHISVQALQNVFDHAPQPKGRNEKFKINGTECILNLVKNPTGANEVMKVIEADDRRKSVLIVLNDREQDGTDVSWIYDTHFEKFINEQTAAVICTGTRAYDMALRMKYEGYEGELHIIADLQQAVDALTAQEGCVLYAIATYTALLPTRNAIVRRL